MTIRFPHFLMSNFLCSFGLTVIFQIFPFQKKISLSVLCCKLFSQHLPAAPAAAPAASERPSLTLVGSTISATRTAAHRSTPPLVGVLAPGSASSLRRWKLAREPEWRRRRDGSGRRGRRLPHCCSLFLDRHRGWHNRLQSRSLVGRFAFLATIDQVRHQLPGGDPAGVGGQVDPVARPDARTVHGSQVLR